MRKKEKSVDWYAIKNKLEGTEEIRVYLAWLSLPDVEKRKIWYQWNRYYEVCQGSKPARLFEIMKKAFKDKKYNKVAQIKRIVKLYRENHPPIEKPQGTDPNEFYQKPVFSLYKKACRETGSVFV